MKRFVSVFFLCLFLIPCAYAETITYDNGKYVGDVSNGVPHGWGTYTWVTGEKYVGEFKDAKWHGHGTLTWANGAKYVGEWKDGNSWKGIRYRADGTVMGKYTEGAWQPETLDCVKEREYIEDGKNMIDCELATGERYVGGYERGLWNGHGISFYTDGSKYDGEYKDGLYHGQGTYTFADGENYVGEWKDGGNHGQGTHTRANGEKYIGEYKYGSKWAGIFYNADGTVRGTYSSGEWIPK
jgi:hypothetical protein